MSYLTFEAFKQTVEDAGLRAISHSHDHWKITGGEKDVNVWANSLKGFRYYVQGAKRGQSGNLTAAIKAAGRALVAAVESNDDRWEASLGLWGD